MTYFCAGRRCFHWLPSSGSVGALAALVFCAGEPLSAQQPLVLRRVAGAIEMDGVSDEAAWQGIEPLPLVAFQPTYGAAPAQRSEILLAYDSDYIYAAARFYVRDASQIRAASLYRDRTSGDDVFRVLLDSFNDNETALVFETTPAGVRIDHAVADDGRTVNTSWNAHWDVATRRTREGWFAEMRIPLATLRFQPVDGRVEMGLIASRFSAATNELVTFPALSPEYASAQNRPSIAHDIVLEEIESRRPLFITPYALSGVNRTAIVQTGAAAFAHEHGVANEAGIDLKYGVTSNLTLDVSVNTDFAQVEADDQQVNLTRFSLFFPERRQFFQERAGVFGFSTGAFSDASRLFHSRRIGLTDDGRPLRIYGGARVVGRVGPWDIAALDMQVEADGGSGSENLGVVRLRRQLNSGSFVGAIATTRLAGGHRYNIAYGVDTQLRAFGNDYLSAQWAQTFDDARPAGLQSGVVNAIWERRSAQGLVYSAWAKWSGPEHEPGLGFAPRRDFSTFGANLRYGWYPGEPTIFNNIQPSLLVSAFTRNPDGVVDTRNANLYLNWRLKAGWSGFLVGSTALEDLAFDLPLSPDVRVPAGRHEWRRFSASFFPPQGQRLRLGVSAGVGGFYDGEQLTATLSPTWNVSEHLELTGEYAFNRIRFGQRKQRFNADIARLRVQSALNAHLSGSSFLQYSRAGGLAVANVRVRYHFSEGRDLYMVYNERLNTDRQGRVPEPPLSQDRALVFKYAHTFAR